MAITPVSTSETAYAGSATTHDVTLDSPAILEDDLILIYTSTQSSTADGPPTATGFTERFNEGGVGSFEPEITCLQKVAVGGEEDDVITCTWGLSVDANLCSVVLRGADPSTPFDVTFTGPVTGGINNDMDPASITTVTDGAWVFEIAAGNDTPTTPAGAGSSGYTLRIDQTPDTRALVIASKEVATAGAEDPGVMWDGAATHTVENFTIVTDAIRPGPTTITPERAGVHAVAGEPTVPVAVAAVPERAGVRAGGRAPEVFQPAPEEFPNATLDLRVELKINGVWTDVSDRLLAQAVSPTRGRADEASLTEPGAVSMILDNADGHLTPGNPNSPWWPYIDQGTELRLSVRSGPPALVIGGSDSTSNASTPDHVDFDVTDLDVRVHLEPDSWSQGVSWVGGFPTLTDFQRIASKWEAATDDRSWDLMLFAGGWPALEWSVDGTGAGGQFRWDQLGIMAGLRPVWIGSTLDVDDGAGSYQATVYASEDETPDSDITTWDVIISVTGAATSIANTDADVVLGSIVGASGVFNGRILGAEFRDSINGSIVADPDFTAQDVGANTFQDSTGKTWTISGPGAEISNWRVRFVGSLDELVPFWPAGDNEPQDPEDLAGETITLFETADSAASEHRLAVTANGILRRLGQGQDPLSSPLRRHIASPIHQDRVTAYWPCEDVTGAVRLAAGLPDHGDMTYSGTGETGVNDSLVASAPLPTIASDETANFTGQVVAGNDDAWAVDWVWRMATPETNPVFTPLISVQSAGDVVQWHLSVNDTNVMLLAYDSSGTEVVSSVANSAAEFFSGWNLGRLEVIQSGDDIEWSWRLLSLDVGTIWGVTDTVDTSTLGRVTSINTTILGPDDGYSFGHIIVSNGTLELGWLAGPDTAWVGEAAAHRFWRLCAEEGIEAEVVGDITVGFPLNRGNLLYSEPMGPQEQLTLLELLDACVAVDLGVMSERRSRPGLIYRTRHTIESQAARMTLDASLNEITHPLEPRRDDQRTRNDLTVSATRGSAAQVIDDDSIDVRGRYREEVTIGGIGGVKVQDLILDFIPGLADAVAGQNLQQAGWRLHVGTWPGTRYPTVTVPLDLAPDQIENWLNLALGDRIQLINLPAQVPDDIIDLIVEATIENMTPHRWIPELTCSPAGIWQIGELT